MTGSTIFTQLKTLVSSQSEAIDSWFTEKYKNHQPFFYNSVDLRHSGFKIAPVDTNVFPAGFNNLSMSGKRYAVDYTKQYIRTYFPEAKSLLLIPENHTRNTQYLENVYVLQDILNESGLEVVLGSVDDLQAPETRETASGKSLTIFPLEKQDKKVAVKAGKTPDIVLINNDLTTGAPALLQDITQPVLPPVGMGWYQRRKSAHFESYNHLTENFARSFGIDAWTISTLFHRCGKINFKEKKGVECVALGVEKVLFRLKERYSTYGIDEEPYVFIKADRGTYGMGIMTVRKAEEVFEMNKKLRNKMHAIKGGTENTEVIIQEGVPTIDSINGHSAEPMIYLIGGRPVGCTYRVNKERDPYSSLNASGMSFDEMPEDNMSDGDPCPVHGLLGRLASLAVVYEKYG